MAWCCLGSHAHICLKEQDCLCGEVPCSSCHSSNHHLQHGKPIEQLTLNINPAMVVPVFV